jgi:Spy/CpxP family protein refolding chaperone
MTSQGKVKLQVWGLIVIVFALGGVTGAALDRLYTQRNAETRPSAPNGERRGRHHNMPEEMRRDLNLSEEQVTAVRNIFDEARKESRKYFDECPGFKEQRERTQARIRQVLTPEQQQRYDEMQARREAERKEKEGR